MVLGELGSALAGALRKLGEHTVVDEEVMEACLKEVTKALLQADVNVQYVVQMKKNIVKAVNIQELAAGLNARKLLEKAVFTELCNMLEAPGVGANAPDAKGKGGAGGASANPKFAPKKGRRNVVMFVGLQGCGKTTTCAKFAHYYAKKGFKPALVCADTFRAGAFDQLKQNATKARIPFYGSYTETDPAKIAAQGVARFEAEKNDLIIVDTSGRHKQEDALFEEMRQVSESVSPDMTIFVMDSSIGQAALDQARAFKQTVDVGSVVVTKLDGHAKGGGAISAVAATKAPILFMGTGEHIDEFEPFDAKPFVSRLLGLGDWTGFIDKISDAIPTDSQPELLDKLAAGQFTMRILYEQFANIQKMGPMSSVMSMIPGFGNDVMPKGQEKQSQAKIKRMMCLMDSMTDEELDCCELKKLQDPRRMERWGRGAGRGPGDVVELIEEYKRLSKMMSKMKGLKAPKKGGYGNQQAMNQNLAQMAQAIPPQMLKQMGGMGALQSMMKQLEGKDMGQMQQMMQKMGGGKGTMPPGMGF
jgi:signal recognition particle subunit SRP54